MISCGSVVPLSDKPDWVIMVEMIPLYDFKYSKHQIKSVCYSSLRQSKSE